LPDHVSADDRGVGPDGCASPNPRWLELLFAADESARIDDVREHTTRATKYVIFEDDAFVNADVVLNLATIADRHVGADHYVLAERTPPADRNIPQYVTEMPNDGLLADGNGLVNIRTLVNTDPRKSGIVTPLIRHRLRQPDWRGRLSLHHHSQRAQASGAEFAEGWLDAFEREDATRRDAARFERS
jgi:hypothetical protein